MPRVQGPFGPLALATDQTAAAAADDDDDDDDDDVTSLSRGILMKDLATGIPRTYSPPNIVFLLNITPFWTISPKQIQLFENLPICCKVTAFLSGKIFQKLVPK